MQATSSIRRVVFGSLFALGLLGASTALMPPGSASAQRLGPVLERAPVSQTIQTATSSTATSQATELWRATVYRALSANAAGWDARCQADVQSLGDTRLQPLVTTEGPAGNNSHYVMVCKFTW
jgi:hypothetical protein